MGFNSGFKGLMNSDCSRMTHVHFHVGTLCLVMLSFKDFTYGESICVKMAICLYFQRRYNRSRDLSDESFAENIVKLYAGLNGKML